MSNYFWKIDVQHKVNKTQVLFNGKEEGLKKLKEIFSKIKSSEIYPSFEKEFKYTFFFYDVSEEFISSLNVAVQKILPDYIELAKPKKSPVFLYLIPFILLIGMGFFGYNLYRQNELKHLTAISQTIEKQKTESITTAVSQEPEQIKSESEPAEVEEQIGNEETISGQSKKNNFLEIFFIDVGQGDCILIKTPKNFWYMIDVGPGLGYRSIERTLNELNVKTIEALVLTHPHEDHIGGVLNLLNNFKIKSVIDPGVSYTSSLYNKILAKIKQKNIIYMVGEAGMKLQWIGLKNVIILNPFRHSDFKNINNASIVIRIKYKKISFMLMGDAEKESESEILSNFKNMKSVVLKVGHHGSTSSTSENFLAELKPKYAVIFCGKGNKFGHPHQKTINLLTENNITIYRTDTEGTLIFRTDGKNLNVLKYDEYFK